MDKGKPRTGETSARLSNSTARNEKPFTPNHPENQPRRVNAVLVKRGLWHNFAVTADPPSISHQPRYFRSHDEAVRHARDLAKRTDALFIDMAREGDE